MSELLNRRLALLAEPTHTPLLAQSLHGIERETLRVDSQAALAMTPHPRALGAALTHPQITTDYSEALLEFITPTSTDPQETLQQLDHVHRFTYSQLGDEYLWSPSMPGVLPAEQDIPVAEYGSSNVGRMKHVYRLGLAVRYGKTMQCIAGIHYNFSLSEKLWQVLQQADGDQRSEQDYISASYIAVIRNFRRYSWLLMYLFGASPALDTSFLRGRDHQLETWDANTLYLPYATSLRMSDLGYQNNAQAGLTPCYDALESYTKSLLKAVSQPYQPFVELGTHDAYGQWQQLNTNVLQIENEYYSNIRPKRVTHSGERPVQALMSRGIQYIEVRCLDINPFLPLGIDLVESRFLDTFLLYCALQDSPMLMHTECVDCNNNFLSVVKEGRRPALTLARNGQRVALTDWANELITAMQPVAKLLDEAYGVTEHSAALQNAQAKVADVSLTPSAQVLAYMREHQQSFNNFAMEQTHRHAEHFKQPLAAAEQQRFVEMAAQSLAEQAAIEANDSESFDEYVARFQQGLQSLSQSVKG